VINVALSSSNLAVAFLRATAYIALRVLAVV